jgi:hypothetical protein
MLCTYSTPLPPLPTDKHDGNAPLAAGDRSSSSSGHYGQLTMHNEDIYSKPAEVDAPPVPARDVRPRSAGYNSIAELARSSGSLPSVRHSHSRYMISLNFKISG